MKRANLYHRFFLVNLGVVILTLSTRGLPGQEYARRTPDPSQLADARRVTQTCEEISTAFPPGDRLRQWQAERDNLLAQVRELPGIIRGEGTAVREGFVWNADAPVTDDAFDIQRRRGFLAPHRPGIVASPAVRDLRTQYYDQIQTGMSPEDVIQILGKPDDSFEQNTFQTGYQRTIIYTLAGDRTAFLWFGSDDGLTCKYPGQAGPMRIEAGNPPSLQPTPEPALATVVPGDPAPSRPVVRELEDSSTPRTLNPTSFDVSAQPVEMPNLFVPAPASSAIQVGDTVVIPPNHSLRTLRSTIYTQTDLRLPVAEIRGDQIGCLLRYGDGSQAVAWVDRSVVATPRQLNLKAPVRPIPAAPQPRSDEQVQQAVYNSPTPTAPVRPQPVAFGSSIITFDNQSGEPALVRLVGPTPQEVHVADGGQNTIHRVAPGEYAIYERSGSAGPYRYTRGEPFRVNENGSTYTILSITLHTVANGNYEYQVSSEAEFNRAWH